MGKQWKKGAFFLRVCVKKKNTQKNSSSQIINKEDSLFFSPKKDDDGFAPRIVLPSGELPEPGEEEEEEFFFFFFLGFLFFSFLFVLVVLVITRECALCVMRESVIGWCRFFSLFFFSLSLSLSSLVSRLSFEEKRTDLFFVLKPPSFSFFLRE